MAGEAASILVLGASYGLLPGLKLSCAGHTVTFVGREDEIGAMAGGRLAVHCPVRRSGEVISLRSRAAPVAAPHAPAFRTPATADPAGADLVILAMQEPQFAAPEMIDLMTRIGAARRPCLSIMNLPPPPFLARLGLLAADIVSGVYASQPAWDPIDPELMTLASPDPQAVRLDPAEPGSLTVTLASNFKVAPFGDTGAQRLLVRLARDLSHLKTVAGEVRLPVAMLAHRSLHVPLAKWPMLIAGNCRCVQPEGPRTIAEAVFDDLDESRAVYGAVLALAQDLGALASDLVPFETYARAATALTRPSSLARALAAGAPAVERIDRLVLNLFAHTGRSTRSVEPIIERIDTLITRNRNSLAAHAE